LGDSLWVEAVVVAEEEAYNEHIEELRPIYSAGISRPLSAYELNTSGLGAPSDAEAV
jgi:hypothetical protein